VWLIPRSEHAVISWFIDASAAAVAAAEAAITVSSLEWRA